MMRTHTSAGLRLVSLPAAGVPRRLAPFVKCAHQHKHRPAQHHGGQHARAGHCEAVYAQPKPQQRQRHAGRREVDAPDEPTHENAPMTNDAQRSRERQKPRIAAGPLGRGVYLSDVVLWLMERHEATRVQAATGWLLPVLEGGEHPKLYEVRPSGDATEIEIESEREWFAHDSGERRPLQQRLSGSLLDGLRRENQWPASFGFGLAGAVAWIRGVWARSDLPDDVLHRVGLVGANFALSEADARRCWGWGESGAEATEPAASASPFPLADWAALVAYRISNRGADWALGNQIAVGKAELERRQQSGKNKTDSLNDMGVELGLKPGAGRTVLERALNGDRKRKTVGASGPLVTKVKNGRKVA